MRQRRRNLYPPRRAGKEGARESNADDCYRTARAEHDRFIRPPFEETRPMRHPMRRSQTQKALAQSPQNSLRDNTPIEPEATLAVPADGASKRPVAHKVAHKPHGIEPMATRQLRATVVLVERIQSHKVASIQRRRAVVNGRQAQRALLQVVHGNANAHCGEAMRNGEIVLGERRPQRGNAPALASDLVSATPHLGL